MNIQNRNLIMISFLLFLFFLIEIYSYYAIKEFDLHFSRQYHFFYKLKHSRKKKIDLDTLVMKNAVFDSDLGFDNFAGSIRGRRGLLPGKRNFCSTYGASFTYCDEVTYEQSWQYQIESVLNEKILNMGVGGFCTDQAYLKFLKYYKSYPTDVVVLGFHSTILPDLLTIVDDMRYFLIEPRYKKRGNQIVHVKIPVSNVVELETIRKCDFKLKEIFENDDGYVFLKKYCGIDLIDKYKFPFIIDFLKILIAQYNFFKKGYNSCIDYMEKEAGIHQIINHIFDEFLKKSREYNFYPLIIINCDYYSMDKYLFNFDKNLDYFKKQGVCVIEIRDLFNYELSNKRITLSDLFVKIPEGHYSYSATQIIAHKLTPFFSLLREGKFSEAENRIYEFIGKTPDYKKIKQNNSIFEKINQSSIVPNSYNFAGDPVNTGSGIDLLSSERVILINKSKEALSCARDFLKQKKIRPALFHYRRALDYVPEWIELMNEISWILSTQEENFSLYENEAILLARNACEATRNSNPIYLDTLAAAYARAGKFGSAVGIAEIAKEMALKKNDKILARNIENRKKKYLKNKYYIGDR
jgi:hypothetical protein